jgi:hypothetical protein
MKRTLSLLLFVIALACSCKKDSSDNAVKPDDVVGQYTLIQWSTLGDDNTTVKVTTSTDAPCMSNLKFTLSADHTTKSVYTGADVCYLYYNSPFDNTSIGAETTLNKWSLVNSELQLTNNIDAKIEHFTVTKKDGKIQLSHTIDFPHKYTFVYIKQ